MSGTDDITRFLTRQAPADLDVLLPMLVLSKGIDYQRSPTLLQMMNRFFATAGVTAGLGAEEATYRLERHITHVALNQNMVQELVDLLHQVGAEDARKRAEEAGALMSSRSTSKISNEPPPEGSVSARNFVRPPGGKIR